MDNLTDIQVFNVYKLSIAATINKTDQAVYQAQFYGPFLPNYLVVFYYNNSIVFYDITQSQGTFIGLINS